MSNFCMYEFEDNVWDEFSENDDHIVPYAADEHKDQFARQADSCKKSFHELHGVRRSTDYMSIYDTEGKEKLYLPNLTQKERMLEKGSWSHTPKGVFSSCDSDSCKELKTLTADSTRMSDDCFKSSNIDSSGSELCADDTILGDKSMVEDDSVCQYPINHISQTDNELSFLDNDEWLDIGNFEDVDRMLSFDLNFGMGSLNNEEEFCWLSTSHGTEGSDDASKSDLKFSCAEASSFKSMSDYNIVSKENIEGLPINDSNKKASIIDKKLRSQMDVDHDAVPDQLLIFSESDVKSGNTDDMMPKEKMQGKLSKSSTGRRKNGYLENSDSVNPFSPVEQCADLKQAFEASSSGVTSQDSIQKHRASVGFDSLGRTQTQITPTHPEYSHAPNYTSLCPTLSGSRSEHDGHPSPLKESSYTSNMESSHGHPLEAAALKTNEKREKLYHCRDSQLLRRSFKNENMASPVPFHSPGSAQQLSHQFENENEGHSEVVGVSIGFSQEIDSSNVQESSSMSSALDNISLEATSFCLLQQVMDQLDIRTRLCIRDSLYRLAKSAEQRHNDANTNGQVGDDVEVCKALMTQDASRCAGFMDVETDTNPIDRSIAHLLFHRPSDQSMLPLNDSITSKSGAMIHGSVTNPPVTTEKQVCREESSIGVEKKSLRTPGEK